MKREVVIFDQDYLDIPLQDLPDRGHIIVCMDPQHRLGPDTWAVLVATSDEGGAPPDAKGLFWDQKQALLFANAMAEASVHLEGIRSQKPDAVAAFEEKSISIIMGEGFDREEAEAIFNDWLARAYKRLMAQGMIQA